MPERSRDWLRQAEADLQLARSARDIGRHEWSCFASQQAAEKAVKGLYQRLHMEAWALTALLEYLTDQSNPSAELMDKARCSTAITFRRDTRMGSSVARQWIFIHEKTQT
jgi:HEPN domain-containing protein